MTLAIGLLAALFAVHVAATTVEDLERLVKLKEQGHIDENQYQQFVEKLLEERSAAVSCPCANASDSSPPPRERGALSPSAAFPCLAESVGAYHAPNSQCACARLRVFFARIPEELAGRLVRHGSPERTK